MQKVLKAIRWIVDNSICIGCIAVILMMLTTVVDVTFRFFKHPVMGSIEITTTLMVCVVFFGMGRCSLHDIHLKVDLFKRFPILDSINRIVVLVLCGIVGWQTIIQGLQAKKMHSVSQLLRIPKYPFVFVAAFGFFIIALAILVYFFSERKSIENGQE